MEIFNDQILRATLLDNKWVCVEWLTNTIGYLSKTVVKDLKKVEQMCKENNWLGWTLGSEIENKDMHKLIQRFGGTYVTKFQGYRIYRKVVK